LTVTEPSQIEDPAEIAARQLESLHIGIDRKADVPIGVQIAWGIRARIGDGTLRPGQRLPGLRELAQATGVNINTVRAVYQRLEHDGLIETQQGTGTFVASTVQGSPTVGEIATDAAREAYASGIDPRDVAAALYASPNLAMRGDPGSERRRLLRLQITALEQAIGEIEVEHPTPASGAKASSASPAPRLLGTDELEQVRVQLLRRLASLQMALAEQPPSHDHKERPVKKRKPAADAAKSARTKAPRRPRPAARTSPASS
jgi:DNA-binding transcriptional regulator YhcF (GntR family)